MGNSEPNLTRDGLLATHLNRDHCERENVCFLINYPTLQDLWRRPLLNSNILVERSWTRVRFCNDRSNTETHNPCAALSIYEDV